MRAFKYAAQIGELPCCPPEGCSGENVNYYRFVHRELTHPNNFRPPAVIRPPRLLPSGISDRKPCAAYALSFYVTEQSAERAYRELVKKHKNARITVGDHLAVVAIAEDDGLLTPGPRAHRDLYEFKDADLQPRTQIVKPLASP